MRYFLVREGEWERGCLKAITNLQKKLYKAKVTLGFQMEIRHEDKTVQ